MSEKFGAITTTPINPNAFSGGGSNTEVDQAYNPESENAQSGKAVAEAIEGRHKVYYGTELAYKGIPNFIGTQKLNADTQLRDAKKGEYYLNTAENALYLITNVYFGTTIIPPSTEETIKDVYVEYQTFVAPNDNGGGIVNIADGSITVQKLEGVTYNPLVNLISGSTTNQSVAYDGTFADSDTYRLYEEKIYISKGETLYRLNTNGAVMYCEYDENDIPVNTRSAIAKGVNSLTVSKDNCVYVRISEDKKCVSGQVWARELPTEYIPYGNTYDFSKNPLYADLNQKIDILNEEVEDIQNNINTFKFPKLTGKKWLFMGDSITNGLGEPNCYFAKCVEYSGAIGTNKGIGGSLISNGQYSSQRTTSILSLSTYDETSEYYIDFSQYDILTIFAGTNDWGFDNGQPTDIYTDTADGNYGKTVCGSLNTALKNIQEKNPNLRICVFTPMYRDRRSSGDGLNSDEHNYNAMTQEADVETGFYLYDMADLIEEACRINHIPCKNLYRTLQVNKYNASIMLNDGVHPTVKGHEILANVICQFVSDNVGF